MADLTPDQIKLEQERLDLLQKQTEAAKNLAAAYKNIEKAGTKLSDTDKEIVGLTKDLASFSSTIEKSIQKRLSGTATSKDLAKSIKQLEYDKLQNERKYADIGKTLDKQKSAALAAARKAANEEKSIQAKINGELINQDNIRDKIERYKKQSGPLARAGLDAAREELRSSNAAMNILDNNLKKTKATRSEQINLAKNLIETKKAQEDNVAEREKELILAKAAEKQAVKNSVLDTLKQKFNTQQLKDMLTLEGFFKLIIDAALRFNETSVKISKSFGYSNAEADRLTQKLAMTANHSDNINVTLKSAGEAMSQLNSATGGVAEYSSDTLETQIMLTKQLGLSGDEAAGLYKFSVLTGQASSVVNDKMVGAFVATRNATRGSADFKATMAEVAKISGQLAANFKNNPAELTKAVVQAQALGTTLQQTKDQGKSLLDFESSIESELKAELLTGQSMNLERARAAALQGDQLTVMKELSNQGMTLNKFQNMNVIAQESFAKALGLSADQLAEQLKKQKIAQEQGKSLAQMQKEDALQAEKRQTLQDKFNAAVEKVQDFFGNLVAGPFGEFVSLLGDALDTITAILYPFQLLYDFTSMIGKAIFGWVNSLGVVGKILKVIAGIAIVMAAYSAYASLSDIPIVGPILGGIAAAAIIAGGFGLLNTKSAGDMMSPADGKTQVSTKEGGLFELSKNDDLVAFPGAAKAAAGGKGGGGGMATPSIDLTPMINAINAVKAAVDRLHAKDTSIVMDGKAVGNTLTKNSSKAP